MKSDWMEAALPRVTLSNPCVWGAVSTSLGSLSFSFDRGRFFASKRASTAELSTE